MNKATTYRWRHEGVVRARFCAAATPAQTVGERLVFDYKVSMRLRNTFVEQPETESISLHEMVVGDLSPEDKAMHVGALSDFMKTLLLTTPSAAAMQTTLESTGLDPLGALTGVAVDERTHIYSKHV